MSSTKSGNKFIWFLTPVLYVLIFSDNLTFIHCRKINPFWEWPYWLEPPGARAWIAKLVCLWVSVAYCFADHITFGRGVFVSVLMRNRMLLVLCLGLAHAITIDELALSYDGRMSSTFMSGVNFAGAGFSVRGRGTQIGFQPENPRRLLPDTWQRKLSEKFGLLSVAKLKGSIGEGSNHSNFSDQSSVKILSE